MFPEPLISWWLLQRARASSHRPPQWFHRRQEATLRRLLVHAYGNVPLYRQLYDEAGFRPEMFRTLDDLARIPPLTKATLKGARDGEAMAQGVNRATCTVATTSGSTGMPMRILMGPYERSWNRAVAWRILFEHGFRWTDRSLEIRMRHQRPHPLQRLGLAPKDWVSILADPAEWARLLERQRYGFLVAGAGTLEVLAQAVAGQPVRHPRVLISDSEPLTPRARALIRDALGSDPVDVYGLEEVSNFAWECERHAGLHVSADSHLVEVDASPGNTGPLRVTALGMWTMPIIRYETGDLAAWATEPCRCGRTLPLLAAVHGRGVDSIATGDGRQLLWPFFHELLGAEADVLCWQVRQQSRTSILVRVVLRQPSADVETRVAAELRRRLPPDLNIEVQAVATIPLEANGKRRLVVHFP
jgi:phenylacetate-CoA ligase